MYNDNDELIKNWRILFNKILLDSTIELYGIVDNYFKGDDLIKKMVEEKKDIISTWIHINEFSVIASMRLLLYLIRVMVLKPDYDEKAYKDMMSKLFIFINKVNELNTLDRKLYMTMPSVSGVFKSFDKMTSLLYISFIKEFDVGFIEIPNDVYKMVESTLLIVQMVDVFRILLVNASYLGGTSIFTDIIKEITMFMDRNSPPELLSVTSEELGINY